MATTFQWLAFTENLTSAVWSGMDALANSTSDTSGFSSLSNTVGNSSEVYQYINLRLSLNTQGSSRSSGGFVGVFITYALDGSTYDADSNLAYSELLAAFPLDAATTARQITKTNLPIPPVNFKLYVCNKTGQALANSGNSLMFRRHNEQGV